jgi:hypothetical protein
LKNKNQSLVDLRTVFNRDRDRDEFFQIRIDSSFVGGRAPESVIINIKMISTEQKKKIFQVHPTKKGMDDFITKTKTLALNTEEYC